MNFLGMGPMELMLILVLALIVFGPGKLPEVAGQVGKAVRDMRRATSDLSGEFNRTLSLELEEKRDAEASKAAAPAPAAETVPVAPAAAVEPPSILPAPAEAAAAEPSPTLAGPAEASAAEPAQADAAPAEPVAVASAPLPTAVGPTADAQTVATAEPPLADTTDWHWEEPWSAEPAPPAPGDDANVLAADTPPASMAGAPRSSVEASAQSTAPVPPPGPQDRPSTDGTLSEREAGQPAGPESARPERPAPA